MDCHPKGSQAQSGFFRECYPLPLSNSSIPILELDSTLEASRRCKIDVAEKYVREVGAHLWAFLETKPSFSMYTTFSNLPECQTRYNNGTIAIVP